MIVHVRIILQVTAFLVLSCALVTPLGAAIGIFDWHAADNSGSIEIHYLLNLDGDSGRVEICPDISGSPGAAVKTVSLSSADLTPGTHAVVWDGRKDDGTTAPSGSYLARVTVHAAPVPTPISPLDPAQMPSNLFNIKTAALSFYGLAVDINPANNNQQNPDKSSYGLVYVSNTQGKRIEVFNPDRLFKNNFIISTTYAPWGIGVGKDGRYYTVVNSSGVLYNYAADGTDLLGGNRSADAPFTGATWGSMADGTGRFQTLHVGKIVEWPILSTPYPPNPNDLTRLSNYDVNNRIEISTAPIECAQTVKDTSTGYLYAALYGGSPSLRRYAWNGSTYTLDPNWLPACGTNVCGVSISCADPNILIIGRQFNAGTNLERWYIEHPDPTIDGPAMLDGYKVSNSMVHNTASDPRGNVIFDADALNRKYKQGSINMFVFPDNGSEDTRVAGPFVFQGSDQSELLEHISQVDQSRVGSRIKLQGKILSAGFDGFCYVQEPERTAGLRVEASVPAGVTEGTKVDVTGTVDFSTGERRLTGGSISLVSALLGQ